MKQKYYKKKVGDMTVYYYQDENLHWFGRLVPPEPILDPNLSIDERIAIADNTPKKYEHEAYTPPEEESKEEADHARIAQVEWGPGNYLTSFHDKANLQWKIRAREYQIYNSNGERVSRPFPKRRRF